MEIPERRFPPSAVEVGQLLDELDRLGARRVILTFLPLEVGVALERRIGDAPVIVAGHPGDRRGTPAGAVRAVSGLAPSADGIHRRQRWSFVAGDGPAPSLESLAADRWPAVEAAPFLVDFRGGAASLPAVSLAQVLGGRLVDEMVGGRHVLVGPVADDPGAGVRTPLDSSESTTPRLRFHGHAVDTLLAGRAVRELPRALQVVLLAALAWLSAVTFSRRTLRTAQAVWVAAVLGVLVGYSIALAQARLRLPGVELLAGLTGVALLSYRHRALSAHRQWLDLETTAANRVRKHVHSSELSGSDDPWSRIVTMVLQVLEVERLIFLEKIEGERRVRAVEAAGCELDAIAEKRRDFTRSPYREAIEELQPRRVEGFLAGGVTGEVQYLVPLMVGHQVQGVWVLGVLSAQVEADRKRFEAILRQYGRTIAAILFERRQSSLDPLRPGTVPERFYREDDLVLARQVRSSLAWFDERLARHKLLLRSLNQAVIVYDLLGYVLEMSATMAELLQQAKLPPYDLSALELAVALTGQERREVRAQLREVIVSRKPQAVPLEEVEGQPGALFVLRLRPLVFEDDPPEGGGPSAFDVHGIVIELDNVSESHALWKSASGALRGLERELRNSLETYTLLGRLLGQETMPDAQRLDLAGMLSDTTRQVERHFEATRAVWSREWRDVASDKPYPVDAKVLLEQALGELAPEIAERGVELERQEPGVMREVLASSAELCEAFTAMLRLLVDDAVEGGGVRLRVVQEGPLTTFDFENQGYGLPLENLQDLTFGTTATLQLEVQDLRLAVRRAEAWGGRLELDSEIGRGIKLCLVLRTFL